MTDPQNPRGNAAAPPPEPAPQPGAANVDANGRFLPESPEAKTMGMLAHLLAIFTGFIGPLIIWLIKKDTSPFVNQQGKEALNWAITVAIAYIGIVVLGLIPFVNLAVCLLWPAVLVCNIVFGILSSIAVNKGEPYRYPICIRIIS